MCDEEMSSVSLFDWSRCNNNAVVFQLLLIRPLQSGHFLQG